MWSKINDDKCICYYCKMVKDRKELWSKIKDPNWAFSYCERIKNRPEVKKYIKPAVKKDI